MKESNQKYSLRLATLVIVVPLTSASWDLNVSQHTDLIRSIGACDDSVVNFLVGRSYSPSLSEYARRLSGAHLARPMGPNFPTSADHRSDRLNIQLDDRGIVRGFRCG
jgi:hypothetical protein